MDPVKMEELIEGARAASEEEAGPDGEALRAVPFEAMQELARTAGASMGEAERAVLAQGLVPRRYLRNIGTLGLEGQLLMLESRVAVFGLGGLGGSIAELLARLGVGGMVLVDGDRFSDDNLNRQALSHTGNLGAWKAEVAAERIAVINPSVMFEVRRQRAGRTEMEQALAGCDVAMDALDSVPSRLELEKACAALGVPLVHGAIAGFAGQVMTVFPGDHGLRAIYPGDMKYGVELATGNPASTPAVVAALEVNEAVKIITGIGEPLRNRLLFIDIENNQFEITNM